MKTKNSLFLQKLRKSFDDLILSLVVDPEFRWHKIRFFAVFAVLISVLADGAHAAAETEAQRSERIRAMFSTDPNVMVVWHNTFSVDPVVEPGEPPLDALATADQPAASEPVGAHGVANNDPGFTAPVLTGGTGISESGVITPTSFALPTVAEFDELIGELRSAAALLQRARRYALNLEALRVASDPFLPDEAAKAEAVQAAIAAAKVYGARADALLVLADKWQKRRDDFAAYYEAARSDFTPANPPPLAKP